MEVALHDILHAREVRVAQQMQLLEKYSVPLICFTMNIAGPIKTSPLIDRGFCAGMAALEERIPEAYILNKTVDFSFTGNTAFYSVQMDASQLKNICIDIEESSALGRLYDMDVINTDGCKLQRDHERNCMVCGAPGRGCAASRAHSIEQLQAVTTHILMDSLRDIDAARIASEAVQSLIDEVDTTPKPGLVDLRNNGSHTDMERSHFIASAQALLPYFTKCTKIGQNTAHLSPEETFLLLRSAGIDAEKTMHTVTGGVNTHKGVIYTLGVLCGSIGRLWSPETPICDLEMVLSECAKLVRTSVKTDFANANGKTAGETLYRKYGIGGVRSEVANGLPSVKNIGLVFYHQAITDGFSRNDAGVYALLHLIAMVTDTNLYHRGGKQGAQWAMQAAATLLEADPYPDMQQIETLDDAFISRNLSPGGCADLLAVTYFLSRIFHNGID